MKIVDMYAPTACGSNSVTVNWGVPTYGNYKEHPCKKKHSIHDWYAPYTYAQPCTTVAQSVNYQGYVTAPNWNWITVTGSSIYYPSIYYPSIAGYSQTIVQTLPTPEQQAESVRQAAESQAKFDAAAKRAEELLFLHLSDEQRRQYEKEGYFEASVRDRLYRINKGRAMNVELIEGGKAKFKYCALPRDYAPAPDVMLAQLLMLETDEARFLATANRTVL